MSNPTNSSSPRRRWFHGDRVLPNPKDMIIGISQNPLQIVTTILVAVALGIMLLLGAVCIWPYFISSMFVDGALNMSSMAGKVVSAGGISAIIGLLFSIYLCWFFDWGSKEKFKLGRIWLIIYAIEMAALFIMMPIMKIDLLASAGPDGWTNILRVLFHGIVGLLLPLLPSFLVAFLGYCANRLWYFTHRHLL